jgi:hypothetical protein
MPFAKRVSGRSLFDSRKVKGEDNESKLQGARNLGSACLGLVYQQR